MQPRDEVACSVQHVAVLAVVLVSGGVWVLSGDWKQEAAVESRPLSSGDRALDLTEPLNEPASRSA